MHVELFAQHHACTGWQGDMARRIAAFDWAATGLGPLDGWPASLVTAVRTVLASPLPLVSACAGRPGCAKALADVRSDARTGLAAGRFTERVHLSGCERRCGSPRGPHRALVALAEGHYTG